MVRRVLAWGLVGLVVLGYFVGLGFRLAQSPSRQARLARATAPTAPRLSIRVMGNHFVNQNGEAIRLLGVNRPGMDAILPDGQCLTTQSFAPPRAMARWHINALRLPLNEDCWLGINGVNRATAAAYRAGVKEYVVALNASGIYSILDLHRTAPGSILATQFQVMPDEDHSPAFWSSVATTFVSHPAVIFDLYNEPQLSPTSAQDWACWLNGCTVDRVDIRDVEYPGQETTLPMTWHAAGMQQLVNAVRRTGARQPIMVEGLNYANDLSRSSKGPISWLSYEPVDPLGQLVASVHVYPGDSCVTEGCWKDQYAAVAQKVPVVTGELGEADCTGTFIEQYMQFADAFSISYLAWEWTPQRNCIAGTGDYGLITNFSGTPTPLGAAFKAHLASLSAVSRSERQA
jgi:hypothetical protein